MKLSTLSFKIAVASLVVAIVAIFIGIFQQDIRNYPCVRAGVLCSKTKIDRPVLRFFKLDYCAEYMCAKPGESPADAEVRHLLSDSLESYGQPEGRDEPRDNERLYDPESIFLVGGSEQYLLYWELTLPENQVDRPIKLKITPRLYLPGVESRSHYGDPYDRGYAQSDAVEVTLQPGDNRLSHRLAITMVRTDVPGVSAMKDDISLWPLGVYHLALDIKSDQVNIGEDGTVESYFTLEPPPPPPSWSYTQ
jgi:hypothetical protein